MTTNVYVLSLMLAQFISARVAPMEKESMEEHLEGADGTAKLTADLTGSGKTALVQGNIKFNLTMPIELLSRLKSLKNLNSGLLGLFAFLLRIHTWQRPQASWADSLIKAICQLACGLEDNLKNYPVCILSISLKDSF